MKILALIFTVVSGLLHLYFLVLEMFLWTKPMGMRTFGLANKEFAESTRILAANQGLYNGFLAAGIFAGLLGNYDILIFFSLICMTIAGIFGAYSTGKSGIFIVQSLPALIALIFYNLN